MSFGQEVEEDAGDDNSQAAVVNKRIFIFKTKRTLLQLALLLCCLPLFFIIFFLGDKDGQMTTMDGFAWKCKMLTTLVIAARICQYGWYGEMLSTSGIFL